MKLKKEKYKRIDKGRETERVRQREREIGYGGWIPTSAIECLKCSPR